MLAVPLVLLVATGASASAPAGSGVLPQSAWNAEYQAAAAFYGKQTGIQLRLKPHLVAAQPGVTYFGQSIQSAGTFATTFGLDRNAAADTANPAVQCVILVQPQFATAGVIGHEVFHCLQLQVLGSDKAYEADQINWVVEGEAAYAGCRFAGSNREDVEIKSDSTRYYNWIVTPGTPLVHRVHGSDPDDYSAIGFWGLLQQAGINVFKVMPDVVRQPSSASAYQTAVAGHSDRVLALWASTLYRDPARTPASDWDVAGPCAPPLSETKGKTEVQTKTLTPGGSLKLGALTYAAGLYDIDTGSKVKIMQVHTVRGYTRVNGRDLDEVGVRDASYCVDPQGCSCPRGTELGVGQYRRLAPSGPVPAIAVSGGVTGALVDVSGIGCHARNPPPRRKCQTGEDGHPAAAADDGCSPRKPAPKHHKPRPPGRQPPCTSRYGLDVLVQGEFTPDNAYGIGEVSASPSEDEEPISNGYDAVGSGSFGWPCDTAVTLQATAVMGSHFVEWQSPQGVCSGTDPSCSFTAREDATSSEPDSLTVVFARTLYTLSVNNVGADSGVVEGSGNGFYPDIDCGNSGDGSGSYKAACTSQVLAADSDTDVRTLVIEGIQQYVGGEPEYYAPTVEGCDTVSYDGGGGAQCQLLMTSDREVTVTWTLKDGDE